MKKELTYVDEKLYKNIVKACYLTRFFDERAFLLSKQSLGGNFHLSAKGHELVGVVGGVLLSDPKHFGFPYYRDRGFAIGKGCSPKELMAAFLARGIKNHSGGRMMPEHYVDFACRIPCQSSVVGSQLLQAVGAAKGVRLRGGDEIVYVSLGDGATSQGDYHEALNFATLHRLPIIFVVQDNGWAISVPKKEQTRKIVTDYEGLNVFSIDGCDLNQVVDAFQKAIIQAKEGPSLVIGKVPRIGPHSSSDDPGKYKSSLEMLQDIALDPIKRLESELGIFQELKEEAMQEIEEAVSFAIESPKPKNVSEDDLFSPITISPIIREGEGEVVTMATAINHALHEIMEDDKGAVVFGQDVSDRKGGVFCITEGLSTKFGRDRCFNTPLAESTIMGLALGLSLDQFHKPIGEIQFADYIWTGVNQLFNEIASYYFRSNGVYSLPIVLRMPCGGYIQGGPYHSQCIEGVLSHIPGLKVVFPSNAEDAKRLLKASFLDPNPVIFLEHKALYRQRVFAARCEPKRDEIMPLGMAKVVQEGSDITLITWGMGVYLAMQVVTDLPFSVEVIDLCTIIPLDREAVLQSVKKTSRVLVFHEGVKTSGFGGEIAAFIAEEAFSYLDAPIVRLASQNLPVPYAKSLEEKVLPQKEDLRQSLVELISY